MGKPKIRFQGYTEDWEQRKLGDVAIFSKGNGYSKGDLCEAGTPIILYGRLYTNYETTIYEVDTYVEEKDNSVFSKGGEVIIPASGETAEDIARASAVENAGILLGGDLNIIEPEESINSSFLALSISNGDSQKELAKKAQGKSVVHVRNDEIKRLTILFPDRKEQDKIVSYFRGLDNLITLHQRKCDETKKLKKYMLQKMFPQNGHSVPEIRFAGFTEDWEQRKFSEFVKNVAKKNKDNLDLEPYAVTNDRGFIAQKDAHDDFGYMKDTDRRAYNIVPPNSFAYNPARINVGSLGYYTGSENVIVSSLYEVFQTEDYIDDRFLWHWLKSDHFPKWIERLQEGSVRLYFYFDKLIQCQMMVPTIKEQNQISAYFDSLDKLITLHQQKCEKLQKIKKFMLQNMFV